MSLLQMNGAQIHYDDDGAGPAVLFLHAFPLSADMWGAQRDALRGRFRTVAVDFPGFGRSQPLAEPASMALFAQAALAALDALSIPRAAVVGLSMGGYVAFELIERAPERVAALALCDTRAGADTEQGRKGREENAQAVERSGSAVLVERLLPNLLSKTAGAARAEVEHHIRSAPPTGVAAALRAMGARRDFTGRLHSIGCPTLVLVGAGDVMTPPSEARAMAQAIPGALCREIASAGHLSNLESPADFNAELLAFLEAALRRA